MSTPSAALRTAQSIRAAFREPLEAARIRATAGDKSAADLMRTMVTAEAKALRELGFSITDNNRLVRARPHPMAGWIRRAAKRDASAALER